VAKEKSMSLPKPIKVPMTIREKIPIAMADSFFPLLTLFQMQERQINIIDPTIYII